MSRSEKSGINENVLLHNFKLTSLDKWLHRVIIKINSDYGDANDAYNYLQHCSSRQPELT